MTIAALKALCSRIPWCEPAVLESVLELALEIAREGREGRRIGTLFTVGKADEVLAASRALILDPLAGHAPARTHISDSDLRGTMKELAQLDGAFVISDEGIVLAACRYLDASVEQIDLPLGFGSRHLAAASISHRLGALAIVVSLLAFFLVVPFKGKRTIGGYESGLSIGLCWPDEATVVRALDEDFHYGGGPTPPSAGPRSDTGAESPAAPAEPAAPSGAPPS